MHLSILSIVFLLFILVFHWYTVVNIQSLINQSAPLSVFMFVTVSFLNRLLAEIFYDELILTLA